MQQYKKSAMRVNTNQYELNTLKIYQQITSCVLIFMDLNEI